MPVTELVPIVSDYRRLPPVGIIHVKSLRIGFAVALRVAAGIA